METFFEKVAEIITASSTKLGLVALMVIVVAFLAYFFFKQESAQTKKKIFAGIVGLLFVLALVVLLLPAGNPDPETPSPPPDTPPPSTPDGETTTPDDETATSENQPTTSDDEPPTREDEPTAPQAPPPVEAWINGANFRLALELAGATYQVVESDGDCSIEPRDDRLMAEVKSGWSGNVCEFKFHEGTVLDRRCRVLEWEFELPDSSDFRWKEVEPESGQELLVHFRMWSEVPFRKKRLFLNRVKLRVPSTAEVITGEINAEAFHAACLDPAG